MAVRKVTFCCEIVAVSGLFIISLLVSVFAWEPIQNYFFGEFVHHASLLYLPHGVLVLAAWLMGWRASWALLPGVIFVFWWYGGMNIILPSRLLAMFFAVTVAPFTFTLLARLNWDIRPQDEVDPCWPCVMAAGALISVIKSALINVTLGSTPTEYVAYVIGDIAGLFFLMLILMHFFRGLRSKQL